MRNKLGSAASAVLAVLLIGAVSANFVENRGSDSISITYKELADNSGQSAADASAGGVSLSFSGEVISIQPDGGVVLKSDEPSTTVIAALSGEYSVGDTLSVSGSISRLENGSVYLDSCSVQELSVPDSEPDERAQTTATEAATEALTISDSAAEQTSHEPVQTATVTSSSAAPTTTAEPVVADEEQSVTVYVSSTGKYHSKSDCSGMKSYTEMSLDEALDAGHVACKRCW